MPMQRQHCAYPDMRCVVVYCMTAHIWKIYAYLSLHANLYMTCVFLP